MKSLHSILSDIVSKPISTGGNSQQLAYSNLSSLVTVRRVLEDAAKALDDKSRTIVTSEIQEVLGGVAGGAAGVGVGVGLVYSLGVTGLSAAGMTSGLATLGAVVGGGMAAGVFVAGAPMAVLGFIGYRAVAVRNRNKLIQEKEALYQAAVQKHDAIIRELAKKVNISVDRCDYLNKLNVLLTQIIDNLKGDLGK